MYDHSHIVKEAAGSAFAPAMGGAGLGALAAHALGVPAWAGAFLGGGAGYLGADHINNALGLGQPYQGPPIGPAPKATGPAVPTSKTVGSGDTMTMPPRDPLAISSSLNSMLPSDPAKPPIHPNASAPDSLRPHPVQTPLPAPASVPPASPGGTVPSSPAPAISSPDALAALSTAGGETPGEAAPGNPTLDALYGAAVPAQQQNPLGLDPRFLQYLELAQDFGGLSPADVQKEIIKQRPELAGITPLERLGIDQGHDERALREKYERLRKQLADK